jgi:hypothetical protein
MKLEVHALPDGKCSVNMTPEEMKTLLENHQVMLKDMKMIKENVIQVSKSLDLIDENCVFREKISMIKLTPKIMGYITNTDKAFQDFGFLRDLLPLLQRYQNL